MKQWLKVLLATLLVSSVTQCGDDGDPVSSVPEKTAQLDRIQAVPPLPSPSGTGTFSLNDDGTELTYDVRVEGVPNIAASHFHNAPAGENGGVVRGIEGAFEGDVWVSSGVWSSTEADQPLTAALVEDLRAGNIYVNIHTADYGSGEIRGQILAENAGFETQLDRAQAVPPLPSPSGTGTFSLNDDGTELTYEVRVEGVPNIAASHFHNAPAGENGGVVRGIDGAFEGDVWVSSDVWSSTESDQPLTAALAEELRAGKIYVNIHTADYGAGEIRGQVVFTD